MNEKSMHMLSLFRNQTMPLWLFLTAAKDRVPWGAGLNWVHFAYTRTHTIMHTYSQ